MILSNVELHWTKLGSRVDMGFDGQSPAWVTEARTRNKEQANKWKESQLNVKTKDDEEGLYWAVSLKKPTERKDGTAERPVPVVGKDKFPIEDVESIGNGTIANVKVRQFDWNYQGKAGTSSRLDAIQILDLVVFEGSGSPIDDFDAV